MRTMKFLLALMALNIRQSMALRGAFLLKMIFMLLNDLLVFVVWIVIFRTTETIRGWTLDDVTLLWGILTASYGISVGLADGARTIGSAVRSGELDSFLTQPKNTLLYIIGSRTNPSAWGDILASIVFFSCTSHVTLRTIPLIIAAVVVAATVTTATVVLVFSLTFWLDALEDLGEQVRNYLITLSSYPADIFPWSVRVFLFTVFPAGFMGTIPANAVREGSLGLLLFAIAFTGAYSCIAYRVFCTGLKRYASGSRISVRAS